MFGCHLDNRTPDVQTADSVGVTALSVRCNYIQCIEVVVPLIHSPAAVNTNANNYTLIYV